jgi:hypothetical protein
VVTRNKARLVAQGFMQIEGLDFDETYAPVARLESIYILLAYATHHDFKLHQMDVKSAFLNGPISELVHVEQPLGFEDPKFPDHIYKLHKELYGLKQAPRAWYKCDEDISPLHRMQGPITRARARQLDLQVRSNLINYFLELTFGSMHVLLRGPARTRRRPRSQGGGARMSTPRRSPGPTRLRLHLGFQNLTSPKLTPWPHTELDLDVLYMIGIRIS